MIVHVKTVKTVPVTIAVDTSGFCWEPGEMDREELAEYVASWVHDEAEDGLQWDEVGRGCAEYRVDDVDSNDIDTIVDSIIEMRAGLEEDVA